MSIRRNTTYNLLGSILPLLLSLVTIPIYIGLIGESRYGVLAISWLLLGYFGLFDLGLGRATAQKIAALREDTFFERAQTFWTALILNGGLGVVGALLIWPVAIYFFGNVFSVEESLRTEIQSAVLWLVLAVPLATFSGVLSGALQGRERFIEINLITVLNVFLFQLMPLAAAKFWSIELGILLPTALLARLVSLILLFHCCRKHVFCNYAPSFDRSKSRQLLRFGGWVTVTSFVGPMMVILDRFLIGAIIGAKAVTYYTVPFQLAQRSVVIPQSLTSALYPRFAAIEPKESDQLAREAMHALVVVMTPMMVVGILLTEPFLSFWISPEFSHLSAIVGQITLLGFWINGLATIPYALLQAQGRPALVAKCHLGEVLPYIGALYLGLSIFGLLGAAVVFTLRTLVDFLLLSGFAGMLRLFFKTLFVPIILLAIATITAIFINSETYIWTYLTFSQIVIIVTWAFWKAPNTLKDLVRTRLNMGKI